TMSYALGIGVNEVRGLQSYSHGGSDIAHRAFAVYFPEINSGVIAMSNNANFPSGNIANDLAEVFFEEAFEAEEEEGEDSEEGEEEGEESAEVEVPLELLESYTGRYMIAGVGVVLEYSVVDGVLKMNIEGQPEATLTPLSQTEFKYEGGAEATVKFISNDEGEVTGAVHSQGGQDYEMEAIPPYAPTLEDLKAYTGTYFSKELGVFYNLELHDSTLVLLIRNTEEVELSAVKEDIYNGDVYFIGEVAFERDPSGMVTGFAASNGRTRGIRFEKY
ncbi:MAG: hypothetical protein KAS29_15400, partial [Bacteroidales bacterium]|nr:hypothetical protein [Bacteroidales bacterium]